MILLLGTDCEHLLTVLFNSAELIFINLKHISFREELCIYCILKYTNNMISQ